VGPSSVFDTYNVGYAQEMFERFLRNPRSVDEHWQRVFAPLAQQLGVAEAEAAAPAPTGATVAQLRAAVAAGKLLAAHRLNGHWAARLDPLGSAPPGHPTLDPAFHGISPEELESIPAEVFGLGKIGETAADVVQWLRATYCGTIGYEYEHLEDPVRRNWLRDAIESGEHLRPLTPEDQRKLLRRLIEVETFEQFLHRAYLGAKRFSIEGTDMLVPMLDLAIERAAAAGAREVVVGMAHRGRLNVLTHVLGKPYTALIAEFEGKHARLGTTGDVKYHLGAEGTYATASGVPLTVTLAPNPSHLEAVDPVVVGMVRAKQTDRSSRALSRDEKAVMAVLIHGDAAFSGQGIVAETLNLAQLEGFRVGGTIHIIVNNQIGFTTEPRAGRTNRYASDMALGYDIPIFHVNADDPEACLAVMRLAMAYHERFRSDVLVDLIGYRRHGHNESDEPTYTQPRMYRIIQDHPTVGTLWERTLISRGVITEEEARAMREEQYQRLIQAQDEVRKAPAGETAHAVEAYEHVPVPFEAVDTRVPAERLKALDRELHTWPADFTVNPKLVRQLERRARVLESDGPIDWAHAETLAFASLLAEGTPVRLTGQDVERGTFSQRHLVLHDAETGETYCPLQNLSQAKAAFEVYNSPLSELGVMGFEYGYSVAAPETLVLWEAQFGDFANGAQVVIDQFVAAGRAKWGQESRLTLLLPHGYEGQGPEHSSARVERLLQLAGEDNMRVVAPTTPANYFHLLRSQALSRERRPLVVITPKSLLRHPRAVSRLADLAEGAFQPVLDDDAARERAGQITRLLLCTGKIYYDLITSEKREAASQTAIVRVEQLYPFPEAELAEVLERYPELEEVVWVQEEPENMGAWRALQPRLAALVRDRARLSYIGRPERASPAEGFANAHEREQRRIVEAALTVPAPRRRAARSAQR
jgi:2-oxoglutarate dehydrogenase E1 component